MQVKNDDEFHGGQRSLEVICVKLCAMATIFFQKKPLMQAQIDDDLHGGQRSSEVNVVKYVLWLPHLVKRVADAS